MATKKPEPKAVEADAAPVTRRRVVAATPAVTAPAPAPDVADTAPAVEQATAPAVISPEVQARIDAFEKLADAPATDLKPEPLPAPVVEEKAPATAELPPSPPAPSPIHVEVPVSVPDQELYERFNSEPHVKCLLPKDVNYTLPNHQIKLLKAGVRMLPRSWATHWFMVASGVTVV